MQNLSVQEGLYYSDFDVIEWNRKRLFFFCFSTSLAKVTAQQILIDKYAYFSSHEEGNSSVYLWLCAESTFTYNNWTSKTTECGISCFKAAGNWEVKCATSSLKVSNINILPDFCVLTVQLDCHITIRKANSCIQGALHNGEAAC